MTARQAFATNAQVTQVLGVDQLLRHATHATLTLSPAELPTLVATVHVPGIEQPPHATRRFTWHLDDVQPATLDLDQMCRDVLCSLTARIDIAAEQQQRYIRDGFRQARLDMRRRWQFDDSLRGLFWYPLANSLFWSKTEGGAA